ncbi:MAG TPA: hypothetical protein VGA89_03080 [Patescibacteria group bacterium]|jgi:hypothetical protein
MKTPNLADQLKKLQQRKDLLVILLLLFVIAVFWIVISIFSSQQRSGITDQQRLLAQPLSPNLDTIVIDELAQKTIYSAADLADFPVFVLDTSQPLVTISTGAEGTEAVGQDQQIILPEELQGALEDLEDEL